MNDKVKQQPDIIEVNGILYRDIADCPPYEKGMKINIYFSSAKVQEIINEQVERATK